MKYCILIGQNGQLSYGKMVFKKSFLLQILGVGKAVVERTFFMISQSTLDKLNNLANKDNRGSKQAFKNIVVMLGVKPVEHFPKLKDKNGKAIKDEDGNDRRSETRDGYTYTFADFETCRVVKVVLDKLYDIKVMSAYLVSGYGYDIRGGNMIFIDEEVRLQEYK